MKLRTCAKLFSNTTLAAILSLNMSYAQSVETPKNKVQLLKEYILENIQHLESPDNFLGRVEGNKFRVGDYAFDLSVDDNSLNVNYVKDLSWTGKEISVLLDENLDGVVDNGFFEIVNKEYSGEITSKGKNLLNEENKASFQQKFDELIDVLLNVYEQRKNVDLLNSNTDSLIIEKSKKVARCVKLLGEDNDWNYEFSFERDSKEYIIKGVFCRGFSSELAIFETSFDHSRRWREVEFRTVVGDRYLDGKSDYGAVHEEEKQLKNFNEFRNNGLEHKEFFQAEYERLLDVVIARFSAIKLNDVNLYKLEKNH